MKISNNIHILQDLCAIKDQPAHILDGMPNITNRLSYILKRLIDYNVPFEIDRFVTDFNQTYYNVYTYINDFDESKDTLILMAHHDVINTEFDNCNDNSASIFILLQLSKYYNNIKNLNYNLVIVFTDSEERGFSGASRLASQINSGIFQKTKIIHIINLELCAFGNSVWIEKHTNNSLVYNNANDFFTSYTVGELEAPPSDSTFLRSRDIKNSTTIGILDSKNGVYDKSPWSVIHTEEDKFEQAKAKDMSNLFYFLKQFIVFVNRKCM